MAFVEAAGLSEAALRGSEPGELEAASAWRGKRLFDVAVVCCLLVVMAPVMAAVALAIKLTSRGPVLFKQRRVGAGGREFSILKFRTMHVGAEDRLADDPHLRHLYLVGSHKIPCRHDPRVTRIGRVLRKWSLDELPQLANVLVGHMSLVGPRPVVPDELADYGERLDDYLAVKPGLTGLWQVSGRSRVHFPARADLDAAYRRGCSLWLDVKIVARTPLAVALRQGAD